MREIKFRKGVGMRKGGTSGTKVKLRKRNGSHVGYLK